MILDAAFANARAREQNDSPLLPPVPTARSLAPQGTQNTLQASARVKPPSAMMVEPPIDLVRPVTAYPEARASTEQTEPVHLKDLLKPGKPFVLHLYTP